MLTKHTTICSTRQTPAAGYRLAVLRASDMRAQAQTESARAAVAAFKALGGGWQHQETGAVALR